MSTPSITDRIAAQLGYVLSLPERTVRALAAGIGGTTQALTETLFPEALRGTSIYRVVIGDMQRFLIEQLGDVHAPNAAAPPEPAETTSIPKKIAGQAVDAAGLLAFHISPLWVFAIASDVSAGSRVYLQRLVASLKEHGVLAADAQPGNVEQLLVQIQVAADASARAIDQPPISTTEASASARALLDRYRAALAGATNLLPSIDRLYEQMNAIARRENLSIEHISGIMSIDVAQKGRDALQAAWVVGTTTTDVISSTLLGGYSKTLAEMSESGAVAYMQRRIQPFFEAAWNHFAADKPTWTQRALDWLIPGKRADSDISLTDAADYADLRRQMIETQIRRRGIVDEHVLDAMLAIPREAFLPEPSPAAYDDRALPIGDNQTISQPYMVAAMTTALRLAPHHRVLEIGTGSGYQAAILARLAADVHTVERLDALSLRAQALLNKLGVANIHYHIADGTLGWPDAAPYDRILVTAGAPNVPQPLVDQLADDGRLVIPVGNAATQVLTTVDKHGNTVTEHEIMDCRFVPLIGQAGWNPRNLPPAGPA